MSNTIRWSDTTDKEKTRLILEHVLGYFIMPDSTFKYGRFEMPSRQDIPAGFHWPIAFWNSDVDWWQTRDIATDPVFFDPLRDLNDAWQLVERVTQPPQSQEEAQQFRSTRFMFWFEKANLWACTREEAATALCVAALRACGMEVED